jgi:3-hydroxyisobutyrate dehydrogenase-like beta-hydroxyacid dehydrogenase
MRIGVIGTGKMGSPIARRLVDAGHDVSVYSRSSPPILELVRYGARARQSVADLAAEVEVVLTALPTVETVEAVYAELIAGAGSGQLFIDHSTTSLDVTRGIAARLEAVEASFLDAPVSGGPAGAADGTLTVMVGGRQDVFERAAPVFAAYGKNVRLAGPAGTGQIVKLINQLLVAVHTAASADAAAMAIGLGVDLEVVREVVGTSFGGSTMLLRNLPRFAASDFSPATPVELIVKDLKLIEAEATAAGLVLTVGESVRPLYDEAMSLNRGKDDMSVLFRQAMEKSGRGQSQS